MKTVLTQNSFPLFYESLIQYAWKSIPALPDFLNETNRFLPLFGSIQRETKKRLPEKGNRRTWQRATFTMAGIAIRAAEMLNFCVRDGNRCDHFAIVTRSFQDYSLKTK